MSAPAVRPFPGTFDPITNGHLDVVARACRLLGRPGVGIALSAGKGALFDMSAPAARLYPATYDLFSNRHPDVVAHACRLLVGVAPSDAKGTLFESEASRKALRATAALIAGRIATQGAPSP